MSRSWDGSAFMAEGDVLFLLASEKTAAFLGTFFS